MPLDNIMEGPRTSNAPVPGQEECESMFEQYLKQHKDDQHKMNAEEAKKFRTAFSDPQFREILADYMDEISDPKHRVETEQYITQLEQDEQVPAGKELVRPEACFVVKTRLIPESGVQGSGGTPSDEKGEKVFVNIVQSDRIAKPASKTVPGGTQWSLPISLGPRRMEADKGGGTLVQTFDACFHPEALSIARIPSNKAFKDYLVNTALEHVEEAVWRLKPKGRKGDPPPHRDKVSPSFHVLRGVSYKNGSPAIMMMAKEGLESARNQTASASSSSLSPPPPPAGGATAQAAARLAAQSQHQAEDKAGDASKQLQTKAKEEEGSNGAKAQASPSPSSGKTKKKKSGATAVKKGFLNSTSPPPPPPASSSSSKVLGEASPSSKASSPAVMMKERGTTRKLSQPSSSSPASGVVVPTFRIKERGQFRASDHMNERIVQPTRPLEIEVAIELPALPSTGDSGMDLDVSNDRLLFTSKRTQQQHELMPHVSSSSSSSSSSPASSPSTAASSYRLELSLPYPCDGAKGKAKFDKRSKELRVTIPVLAPKPVTQEEVIGGGASGGGGGRVQEIEKRHDEEEVTEEGGGGGGGGSTEEETLLCEEKAVVKGRKGGGAASSEEAAARDKKEEESLSAAKGRGGGGGAGGGAQEDEVAATSGGGGGNKSNPLATGRMKFDLPPGATLVQKSAPPPPPPSPAAAASPSTALSQQAEEPSPPSLPPPAATPPPPPQQHHSVPNGNAFEASEKFKGACPGYVFKLGDLGLGYYREAWAPSEGSVAEEEEEEEVVEGEAVFVTPRYDYRQMAEVVTVLVQVPRIQKASVQVQFKPNFASLTFTADNVDDVDNGDTSQGSSEKNEEASTGKEEQQQQRRRRRRPVYRLLLLPPRGGGNESSSSSSDLAFDPSTCRFDVADKNMVVVLGKATNCRGLWSGGVREGIDVSGGAESSLSSSSLFATPTPTDMAIAFPASPTLPLPKQGGKRRRRDAAAASAGAPVSTVDTDEVPQSVGVATLKAGEAAAKHAIEGAAAARSVAVSGQGRKKQSAAGMTSPLPAPSLALPAMGSGQGGNGSCGGGDEAIESSSAATQQVAAGAGGVAPTAFQNSLIFELD